MQNPFIDALAKGGSLASGTMAQASQTIQSTANIFNMAGSLALKMNMLLEQEEARKQQQLLQTTQLMHKIQNDAIQNQLERERINVAKGQLDVSKGQLELGEKRFKELELPTLKLEQRKQKWKESTEPQKQKIEAFNTILTTIPKTIKTFDGREIINPQYQAAFDEYTKLTLGNILGNATKQQPIQYQQQSTKKGTAKKEALTFGDIVDKYSIKNERDFITKLNDENFIVEVTRPQMVQQIKKNNPGLYNELKVKVADILNKVADTNQLTPLEKFQVYKDTINKFGEDIHQNLSPEVIAMFESNKKAFNEGRTTFDKYYKDILDSATELRYDIGVSGILSNMSEYATGKKGLKKEIFKSVLANDRDKALIAALPVVHNDYVMMNRPENSSLLSDMARVGLRHALWTPLIGDWFGSKSQYLWNNALIDNEVGADVLNMSPNVVAKMLLTLGKYDKEAIKTSKKEFKEIYDYGKKINDVLSLKTEAKKIKGKITYDRKALREILKNKEELNSYAKNTNKILNNANIKSVIRKINDEFQFYIYESINRYKDNIESAKAKLEKIKYSSELFKSVVNEEYNSILQKVIKEAMNNYRVHLKERYGDDSILDAALYFKILENRNKTLSMME